MVIIATMVQRDVFVCLYLANCAANRKQIFELQFHNAESRLISISLAARVEFKQNGSHKCLCHVTRERVRTSYEYFDSVKFYLLSSKVRFVFKSQFTNRDLKISFY